MLPRKLVLRRKRDAVRYKARLVICGNLDADNTEESLAPVIDSTIVRLVLSLTVQRKWHVYQLNYSSAFFHGAMGRAVYMMTPKFMNT